MKAELRISVKDYSRDKTLNVLLICFHFDTPDHDVPGQSLFFFPGAVAHNTL
jgi:hypothetical protein